MHSYTGLSPRERATPAAARCQQTGAGELVTSGGEEGLLAAVWQECDSMDISECLDELGGVCTPL